MNSKIIEINNKYYIKITYNNDITRLYTLKDTKEDKTIVSSYNRDAFLIKVNQVVKLNNKIELIVASI